MKNKSPKDSSGEAGKLLKLLQLISFLKASHWTIQQLMERFGLKKSSMYRIRLKKQDWFTIAHRMHLRSGQWEHICNRGVYTQ